MFNLLSGMLRCAIAVTALSMAFVAQAYRIVVFNDLHVSPDNVNSRWLRQAIDEVNALDLDCVVVNGDLTNEGSDAELGYIHEMLALIRHPMYVLPGNHENNWSQSATGTFGRLWGADRFAAKVGDLVIVGVNCGPYMKMGDGHIKQEDLHWLRASLDSLVSDGDRVVSFNHYPMRRDDVDNYLDYLSVVAGYPTVVHFNGHYHNWDRYMAGDIDAVMTRALSLDGTYGYTIVEIDDSSVDVYEQIIASDRALRYHIDINTRHQPVVTSAGDELAGKGARCVHADSASVFTRVACDSARVYFGTSTGFAKAVDRESGETLWQTALGSSLFSQPVLVGGVVAFPHARGIAFIDAETGDIVGCHDSETCYVADGICLGDSLYLQGGYHKIECLADGALVWSYDSIANYCQGAPSVSGDLAVFGAWDTYLRCVDIRDGSLKWRWSNGRTGNLLGPGNVVPVIYGDRVIIVAPDRYMTAIDLETGETLWRDKSHRYRESLGASADGSVVYAKTMDGELVAVNAAAPQFQELWICDMGIGYDHAPCRVVELDGVVYAGSRRGILTAVDAATHTVVNQWQLGSSEINGIEVDPDGRRLWVSLIEGRIYCIEP